MNYNAKNKETSWEHSSSLCSKEQGLQAWEADWGVRLRAEWAGSAWQRCWLPCQASLLPLEVCANVLMAWWFHVRIEHILCSTSITLSLPNIFPSQLLIKWIGRWHSSCSLILSSLRACTGPGPAPSTVLQVRAATALRTRLCLGNLELRDTKQDAGTCCARSQWPRWLSSHAFYLRVM